MHFSRNFFWKLDLIRFFPELHVRKFRKFSPDHFYDENFQFYDKKTDFRPGMEITSETTGTWEPRVKRRAPWEPRSGYPRKPPGIWASKPEAQIPGRAQIPGGFLGNSQHTRAGTRKTFLRVPARVRAPGVSL